MKTKLYLILLVLLFCGCINQSQLEIEKLTIKHVSPNFRLSDCYKLTIQGGIYIGPNNDTIEDYRGIVAYIPMDCDSPDTTKGFDLTKLVIVDTVGYAKVLLGDRRMRKYIEEQKLRVNL